MGYFSWLKADGLTDVVNIASGLPFKCLIPQQFDNTGRGFIEDVYRDYGFLGTPTKEQLENPDIPDYNKRGRFDMYELLAVWNSNMKTEKDITTEDGHMYPAGTMVKDTLMGVRLGVFMKETDAYTDHNHEIGVAIGCYDRDKEKLDFPLKLVSSNYNRPYEQCMGISYSDPAQGCRCLRENLYLGKFGPDCRYDGMKWKDVYMAWSIVEDMRYKNKPLGNRSSFPISR